MFKRKIYSICCWPAKLFCSDIQDGGITKMADWATTPVNQSYKTEIWWFIEQYNIIYTHYHWARYARSLRSLAPLAINWILTFKAKLFLYEPSSEIFLYKPIEQRGFCQFEIKIYVLVSCFCFIWIPMLRVYGHYQYFTRSVRRSTLDVRIWRL